MTPTTKTLDPASLRLRLELTQAEIAPLLGRSISTITKWEAGDSIPKGSPSEIKRLMQVYRCSLDDLINAFEGPNAPINRR